MRSYFWSVFSCIQSEYRKIRIRNNSVFGVNLCIQSEYRKIRIRNNSVFGQFSCSEFTKALNSTTELIYKKSQTNNINLINFSLDNKNIRDITSVITKALANNKKVDKYLNICTEQGSNVIQLRKSFDNYITQSNEQTINLSSSHSVRTRKFLRNFDKSQSAQSVQSGPVSLIRTTKQDQIHRDSTITTVLENTS